MNHLEFEHYTTKWRTHYIQEEELLKLKPNLVLIGDTQNSLELMEFLKNYQIKSLRLPTKSLDDIYESMIMLKEYFPNIDENKIKSYSGALQDIKNSNPSNRRKAIMILNIDPVYTLSTNDYLSEAYRYSGWDSVVQSVNPYPVLS